MSRKPPPKPPKPKKPRPKPGAVTPSEADFKGEDVWAQMCRSIGVDPEPEKKTEAKGD